MCGRRYRALLFLAALATASRVMAAATLPLYTENQRFRPLDNEHADTFGGGVTISGNTAIIGAPYGGVGSNLSGSAYVYDLLDDGSWSQVAELTSADAFSGKRFGEAVDIDGNFAVIGASHDPTKGEYAGAAYVFERGPSGSWTQVAKLMAADGGVANYFGSSVAISGNQIVVGAFQGSSGAFRAGSAYVFARNDAGYWNQTATLTAPTPVNGGDFGVDVDIYGGRVVIGAPNHAAAYVFEQSDLTQWRLSQTLSEAGTNNLTQYGLSVSIDNDTIAVGAPRMITNGIYETGSVFMYERNSAAQWLPSQRIDTSYSRNGYGDFGRDVAVDGSILLIGAEDHNLANGWNGAAYVYTRPVGDTWTESAALVGTGSVDGRFGSRLALDGEAAFIGAWRVEFERGYAYYFQLSNLVPESPAGVMAVTAATFLPRYRKNRRNQLTRV